MSAAETFAALVAAIPSSPTYPSLTAATPPADLAHLSGIERLQANMAAATPPPPAWYVLGYVLSDVQPGAVELSFRPLPAHTNYGGTLHGGILAALADSAMGCAVLSTLAAGEWCATLQMSVTYTRAVRVPGPVLRTRGSVRWRGGSTAHAEASVLAGDEEVLHATSVYAVRRERTLPGQPVGYARVEGTAEK